MDRGMEDSTSQKSRRKGERRKPPEEERANPHSLENPMADGWTPPAYWPNSSPEHNHHAAKNRTHRPPAIPAQEKSPRGRQPLL